MTYPFAKRHIGGMMAARHAQLVETTMIWGGTSTGSANAQIIKPEFAADLKGNPTYVFVAGYTNTGAMTLSADGGTTNTSLRRADGSAMVGGEIVAGTAYTVVLDGTPYWRLIGGAAGEDTATSIAAASTVNIGGTAARAITVTAGTGPITAWGSAAAGAHRDITFAVPVVLTHNATSAILTGGTNISTMAGDTCRMESLGAGNWRMLSFQRANGSTLGGAATQTLNPADKASVVTISNANRTASNTGGGTGSGRAIVAITFPAYWEVYVDTVLGTIGFGVASATVPLTDYISNNAAGYAYLPGGQKATNSSSTSFGDTYAAGDRLCFAFDPSSNKLWGGKVVGGAAIWGGGGNPATGANPMYTTSTGMYPAYQLNGTGSQGTFAFGSGQIIATPPAGFAPFP